jgi:hypothetical protein
MTWTRLPDNFTDQPAMLEVSRSARLLHVEALVWCNRHLTDGRLAPAAIRRMTDAEDVHRLIDELRAARLWEPLETPSGIVWQIDWTDQEPAREVRQRAAIKADKQRRYRDRRARHSHGDHSLCDPRFCPDLGAR